MPRTKSEAPKNGSKKNGNGRKRAADQIKKAWQQAGTWPLKLNDKVKVWVPKEFRGMQGKVIAVGDEKAPTSTRKAPKGKIRIVVKDVDIQFAVMQTEIFPNTYKVKDIPLL